ncbi:MAG: prepilin-type N-terminal cleavage/methylation domain-containing protein [Planctomycetes bacterium]|nr:prepilin-type N-terminal cleavage/methylation domain-containing protein [Planctomycetota bacterium]
MSQSTQKHRQKSQRRDRTGRRAQAGFTLVEMMVSVALVLLMMTMFAQIFQMATGALSKQKGIAENDQHERMLNAILRGDLDKRTFRDVFPFGGNEDTRPLGHSLSRRSGYFEIDEGDPLRNDDDCLCFTAQVNIKLQNPDNTPFTGKATAMSGFPITGVVDNQNFTINGNFSASIPVNSHVWISQSTGNDGRYTVAGASFSGGQTTITVNSTYSTLSNTSPTQLGGVYLTENEPDFDDGVFGNGTSVSSAAEICYFLRNGILYRRVLLIREPGSSGDAQPAYETGYPLMWNSGAGTENYTQGTNSFWRDQDYSAFYFNGKSSGGTPLAAGVRFHNASESLSNSREAQQVILSEVILNGVSNPPTQATSFPISLGIPNLRFGHDTVTGLPQDAANTAIHPGVDLQYGTGDDYVAYLGRFTLRETANTGFGYPGNYTYGNPFSRKDLQVNPYTGLVVQYTDAPGLTGQAVPNFPGEVLRRGEDILMSNVLTFDVKVWDPWYQTFVDVGDNINFPSGPFSTAARGYLNSNYSFGPNHFRFDTWHPLASIGGNNQPPHVPFNAGLDGQPGTIGLDDDGTNGIDDPGELGFPGSDDKPCPISAIQITINFRDPGSGQVRQTTIVQSLIDNAKPTATTFEAPEE